MPRDRIRIGIIGTGFGRQAQIPGFRAAEGAEVVAVAAGHRENAERVAREFGIARVCDSYEELVRLDELDLVSVAAPPYLHRPMALAALDAGKHVLCEKPMALTLDEAREMTQRAEAAGVLNLIDYELRFNPNRRRMKQLIDDGYLGRFYHVTATVTSGFRASAERPWNWWSQRAAGGGLLGAIGSHMIDMFLWLFGDIYAVSGQLRTFVSERRDPGTGEMRPVDSDDFASILFQFSPEPSPSSGTGTLTLSAVAGPGGENHMIAVGESGTLILDARSQLWGARRGAGQLEDLSVPDPAVELPEIADNIWARSFVHLAQEVVRALREGRTHVPGAASFRDGMRVQAVMDAIHESSDIACWIRVARG